MIPQKTFMDHSELSQSNTQKFKISSDADIGKKNKLFSMKQLSDDTIQVESLFNQKASNIVNDITDLLYEEIYQGIIFIEENPEPFQFDSASRLKVNSQLEQINFQENRKKMKQFMKANKKFQQKLKNRTLQFQSSLKNIKQQEKNVFEEKRLTQRQKRRSLIERRLSQKSQIMAKIRQMSIQSQQRFKIVKSKKFLFEQKQDEFKQKVLLPKIEQQKKILQKRKKKMKPMDIKQLIEHEKSYYEQKKTQSINRSITSRIIKSSTVYNPPQFVPKSYQIYQTEENQKKANQIMKLKQSEKNKQKLKQYTQKITEILKMQSQISRTLSFSRNSNQNQKSPNIQKEKPKKKLRALSKKQINQKGNSYFQAILEEIRTTKQKKEKRARQKQKMQERLLKQQEIFAQNDCDDLQIQIRSQSIKTVQKIDKIQRSFKVRSKKIQNIFNDKNIDPVTKYQQLKHQVQNLQMGLKTKKIQSEDIGDRSQAAGCYLNVIKAKLKLLQASGAI